jgi:hypothetical protein
MSGNYAQNWEPRNLGGSVYYDPRRELEYWADRAGSEPMVAVPVATLRAAAEVRECGETTVLTADEDGPMAPLTIRCRQPEGHLLDHYNGYCSWRRQPVATKALPS